MDDGPDLGVTPSDRYWPLVQPHTQPGGGRTRPEQAEGRDFVQQPEAGSVTSARPQFPHLRNGCPNDCPSWGSSQCPYSLILPTWTPAGRSRGLPLPTACSCRQERLTPSPSEGEGSLGLLLPPALSFQEAPAAPGGAWVVPIWKMGRPRLRDGATHAGAMTGGPELLFYPSSSPTMSLSTGPPAPTRNAAHVPSPNPSP